MKKSYLARILILVGAVIGLGSIALPAQAQDAAQVKEMQLFIEAQQKQIEIQQRQVEAQQKQLDEQRKLLQKFQTQLQSLEEETKTAVQTPEPAAPIVDDQNVVTTTAGEQVKFTISGWVNRAVNIVDDGKDTDAYFVDNDNAESRVTFAGSGKIDDDLTLGSVIELTIGPDKAGSVNQNDKEAGDVFDQRITEVTLDSKRFGKLSLGKGWTGSYGTGSRDLSQTTVISYVTIADTAGGMLFRDDDGTLTDVAINEAFQSFDGLNRRSRVRYDTPTYNGFKFSTSLLTEQRYDAALWWGGQGYGFKAIGAAAVADPKLDDTDMQYDGSFSLLHDETGLNFSFSAGMQEKDNQDDAGNLYGKIGWITNFFSVGNTAFAIDYTETANQPEENSDGYSTGLAAVQFFEKHGAEIYFLYRKHSLDRDDAPDVQDIDVVSVGTRVKF